MRILSTFVSATDIFGVFISQFIQQEMTTNYYRKSKLVGHKLPAPPPKKKKVWLVPLATLLICFN